jgi:hypothetical protein
MAYTTIDDPSAYFHTQLYTGNRSSTQTITNDANAGDFKPDWVWIKQRNDTVAHSHNLIDSSRGVTKHIYSNTTDSEQTITAGLTSFNTDGFSIGNNAALNQADRDVNYVAWQWKANGGTATATISESGSNPAATVQANPTAGFSIITYTGTGSEGTIAHGLGATPNYVIVKNRDAGEGWIIDSSIISGNSNGTFHFNTDAEYTGGSNQFGTHSSTNITIKTAGNINTDGQKYVAYVFAQKQGYSKVGKYTGNGTGSFGPFADGPFVYTGFKPAWVMIKRINGANGWTIFDNKRDPHNIVGNQLSANSSSAEEADASHHAERDYLSNGFKLKGNGNDINANGGIYSYIAFAEHPFVSSKGVPVTAR